MPNARFFKMFGMRKILVNDLDGKRGLRSKNKDRVIVITGYEGTGKSNLALCLFEEWYKLLGREVVVEDIKYIASNKREFVTGLKSAQKYDMIIHDEAGKDLYARNSISSFNKDLNVAYQVIRGKNLYTILVIPSVMDLDSFFRRRRVTAMLHVYREGKFAYFSKARLRWILPGLEKQMQYSSDPDPTKVKDQFGKWIQPNFTDSFPLYKGVLKEPYEARKSNNMDAVVDELMDKYGEDESDKKKKTIEESDSLDDTIYERFKERADNGERIMDIRKRLRISARQYKLFRTKYRREDLPVRPR